MTCIVYMYMYHAYMYMYHAYMYKYNIVCNDVHVHMYM